MARRPSVGARALVLGLIAGLSATPVPAQEIYQAVILDLVDLQVHVTVARAQAGDQVRLLVRNSEGRVRQAGNAPVSSGLASGGTTVLMIALPLLAAGDREFAVVLVRDGTEVHRTAWQPLFPGRR